MLTIMKTKNSKGVIVTGVLAALTASSCCIPPVITAIVGVGGIGSSLSWIEPIRPYLIGLAVVAIGYAWYAHLKPKTEDDCGCDIDKPNFYQTKAFLLGMTFFAILSISFPYYSKLFFSNKANKVILSNDKNYVEYSLSIEGMTCSGCEHHVNSSLKNTIGVIEASSSYESGKAFVKFDATKITIKELKTIVEKETGYDVIKTEKYEN